MKLIKINTDHYVVVDETIQPVNGYYYDSFINKIKNTDGAEYGEAGHCWQITHSTNIDWNDVYYITLQEVKELIGEVNVEKNAEHSSELQEGTYTPQHKITYKHGYQDGYNQAIEDNKEKKYTEKDIDKAISWAINSGRTGKVTITDIDNFIQSLQPKTEWEVEIVDGKLKLK